MDKWVECLTRLSSEDDVSTIDWLIAVFSRTNNDDGKANPGIKSWSHPADALKDTMKIDTN